MGNKEILDVYFELRSLTNNENNFLLLLVNFKKIANKYNNKFLLEFSKDLCDLHEHIAYSEFESNIEFLNEA